MNKAVVIGVVAIAIIIMMSNAKASAKPVPNSATATFQRPTDKDIKDSLVEINQRYGAKIARDVEKIYRLETAHFTSGQFLASGSAGMLKLGENYPWGWTVEEDLWNDQTLRPIGNVTFHVDGNPYTYLVFPNVRAGMLSLANYLTKYPPGRWFSTDANKQKEYEDKLASITPKFGNEVLPIA